MAHNLKTIANGGDLGPPQSKRKAITALLPYVVWQERDGKPDLLDTFLHGARASKECEFMWHHADQCASGLLHEASPRVLVLVLPYVRWD